MTVLVYMDADNNLDNGDMTNNPPLIDINKMEMAGSTENVDVLVFLNRAYYAQWQYPIIFHIQKDADTNTITSPLAKVYTNNPNFGDKKTLEEFLNFAETEYPSKKYSLVIWSHGSGWYPAPVRTVNMEIIKKNPFIPPNLSIGSSYRYGGDGLDIDEIKAAMSNRKYEFLCGDACLMAGIEVAYEIRDNFKSFIASQSYELDYGLPYQTILSNIIANPDENYSVISKNTVTSYKEYVSSMGTVSLQKGTMTAVDLGKMEAIKTNMQLFLKSLATSDILKMKGVRKYSADAYDEQNIDLLNFIESMTNLTPEQTTFLDGLKSSVTNSIIAEWHSTNGIFMPSFQNISGISIYFPDTNGNNYSTNNFAFYTNLLWAKETGWLTVAQ